MATVTTPNATNASAAVPEFPHGAKAITTSDVDDFAQPVAVYVGGAGNVVIRPANGGAAVTFVGMAAGTVVPCMAIGVNATNTTATNLVAIY